MIDCGPLEGLPLRNPLQQKHKRQRTVSSPTAPQLAVALSDNYHQLRISDEARFAGEGPESACESADRRGKMPATETTSPPTPSSTGPAAAPPAKVLSFRRNFVWALSSNAIYAATHWGMLVLMAKLLSAAEVGGYFFALAIAAPIFLVTNLNLRWVQATDAEGRFAFGSFVVLRLFSVSVAISAAMVFAWLSGDRQAAFLLLVIVCLIKACAELSDVLYGRLQRLERLDLVAISKSLHGIGQFSALAVVLYFTESIVWGAAGMLAAAALVTTCYDLRLLSLIRATAESPRLGSFTIWSGREIRSLLWVTIPLGLVAGLGSLGQNMPRYFVESYWDKAALGYYSAIAYLMMVGTMFMTALGDSTRPRLAKYYRSNRRAYWRLTAQQVLFNLGIGVCGVLFAAVAGDRFLSLIYRPEYAQYSSVFVWVMMAAACWYLAGALSVSVTAAQRFGGQAPVLALAVITGAAACWWLVPERGPLGAAQAHTIAMAVQAAGYLVLLVLVASRRNEAMPTARRSTVYE